MGNTARRGSRLEHRSKALLEAAGYEVQRAAGSKGTWDLIGISATDIVLVQVKSRDWPYSAEKEALEQFPCPPNCKKIVHRWRKHQRKPDIKVI